MRPLADGDIEESFEPVVLSRGRQYLQSNRVLSMWEQDDGTIIASVQGSRARPYTVTLSLVGKHEPLIVTKCTCPYELQCKHGAAVALKLRRAGGRGDERGAEVTLPRQLQNWLNLIGQGLDPQAVVPGSKQLLCFLIERQASESGFGDVVVTLHNRRMLRDGALSTPSRYNLSGVDYGQFPKHLNEYDRELVRDLASNGQRRYGYPVITLGKMHGARLLKAMIATGRCWLEDFEDGPLHEGPATTGSLHWVLDEAGNQRPTLRLGEDQIVLPLTPPHYVDTRTRACGPVDCGDHPALVSSILRGPPVAVEHVAAVREGLLGAGVPAAWIPEELPEIERVSLTPVVRLRLEILECVQSHYYDASMVPVPHAVLSFDYGGLVVEPDGKAEVRHTDAGRVRIIRRATAIEDAARDTLDLHGWSPLAYSYGFESPEASRFAYCMMPQHGRDWLEHYDSFLREEVPQLEAQGWVVEQVGDLRYLPSRRVTLDLGFEGNEGQDWFSFALGMRVGDEVLDLRDVLAQVFSAENGGRYGGYHAGETRRLLKLPSGTIVTLPAKRLEAILKPLRELFGTPRDWPDELRLPVARLGDLERVEALTKGSGAKWKSSAQLDALRKRLTDRGVVRPMDPPKGFEGVLRDYQKEGLAWLQFLREFSFGGILADDMGLGKTVQLLAHLQAERIAGRHDRPSLVVAPTSTLPNWKREAARFVPDLKVLVLHGPARSEAYERLAEADLAITNYAILGRDRELLEPHKFHLLVLDEAQNIKNAATRGAKAARALDARHRLCLSGTPVENHLDELWSLFEFLMPGFLGSSPAFRKEFRTPIEKRADRVTKERLTARVRPFLLRRTKQQVAAELPPKTLIVETVEFGDPQRDLYELVRVAMDDRIRTLLSRQGLEKSRIHVLDALLKLRQVCCDPRLVKLDSARKVTESAKLERLFEMLPVLIEDGRRILLFSQFTSMLDLIELGLVDRAIPWVRISGDTVDRDTPVQRFQGGEVPLFLISLKAGGTGLNLVAADTVIHYDPWWNPAVERQATDRAHRIGQDKAVMVYKFVALGTVEEKILQLQERKAALADAILEGSEDAIRILNEKDLRWLLEPSRA